MNVIDKIRKLQWDRGWTDYKLAQAADISQSSLATLYARRTCEAFGITLAQFFLEDEKIEVLSDKEKQLLSSFRKLSPEKQKALIELFAD